MPCNSSPKTFWLPSSALRVGKARERGMVLERLQALIDPSPPEK